MTKCPNKHFFPHAASIFEKYETLFAEALICSSFNKGEKKTGLSMEANGVIKFLLILILSTYSQKRGSV